MNFPLNMIFHLSVEKPAAAALKDLKDCGTVAVKEPIEFFVLDLFVN